MTSVQPPNPPNFSTINYNPNFWSSSTQGLTFQQAKKNFLTFPIAQGPEILQDITVNGEITINNPTNNDNFQIYVDANPTYDMTLESSQNDGGITVRTPNNSFTITPQTFNINLTTPTSVTGAQLLNPIDMNNFDIVNMGQYSTAYTQALNTHEDYVATCNYVNDMVSQGGGILDNNNIWTGTNQFENFVNIGTVNASNYYTQISQLSNGALNINNQTPTANFPNINFQCNDGSNVMTNYFSITPQKIESNTAFNMNNQVIYGVNELSFSQTNDLCTIASNLFAPQFIFTNSIAYDINDVPTIVFYLNNTNNVGLNSPLSINTTAVDINNNLFINSGADITLSSGTSIIGNIGAPNTISNVNLTSSTATTPPTTDNDTSIATTAFVQTLTGNPIVTNFTATSGSANSSFVGNATINTGSIVTYGLCSFINTPITIQMTVPITTTTVLAVITFASLPWPTWPNPYPSSLNITTTCLNGSAAGTQKNCTTLLPSTSAPPYTLSIVTSTIWNGLPAGTQFSFNLQNIVQAPFSIN
jgi:hypothetical protein